LEASKTSAEGTVRSLIGDVAGSTESEEVDVELEVDSAVGLNIPL